MPEKHAPESTSSSAHETNIRLARPGDDDGGEMWRIARDSQTLDLNSPYSYLLWCRDFASTSVIAHAPDGACGFVTGYVRPDEVQTLFVWQVAVDRRYRGKGVAGHMLGYLGEQMTAQGRRYLEATVTPDNTASGRLFESFARERGCVLERRPLFNSEQFPIDHPPEVLLRIGPL
jgi:L-2,4-diaminobutyric acid acetyltransferase